MADAGITADDTRNPGGWPDEILDVLERGMLVEAATITRAGDPVTYPLNPYVGTNRRTIDVTSGISYPAKAERARANPKVAMLFSDFAGSDLAEPPIVLVQGLASVRDSDLQTNAERYQRESFEKLQIDSAWMGAWYWTRIYLLTTPIRIMWWPGRDLSVPARTWVAPATTVAPSSDPAPSAGRSWSWSAPKVDWRDLLDHALPLGPPVLSVLDDLGFPALCRVEDAVVENDGFVLHLPAGRPCPPSGAACLTFHAHSGDALVGGTGWIENDTFLGRAVATSARECRFLVDRPLGGRGSSRAPAVADLEARLADECGRRGQAIPELTPLVS